jgi:hypothetical protein
MIIAISFKWKGKYKHHKMEEDSLLLINNMSILIRHFQIKVIKMLS